MRVIVIGAGIGGLTLAQGLRAAGIDVSVYDRDHRLVDTGGYRLHLNTAACGVLSEHLPASVFRAIVASSVGRTAFRRFAFLDQQLRVLLTKQRDPDDQALQIGRRPLRRLLAHGLDAGDRAPLHLGTEFVHAERGHDDTVTAHFSDGRTDNADILVGADGAHSRVTRDLAGRDVVKPVGAAGLVGRTPLTAHTRRHLPDSLHDGPALAFGPGGFSVFLAVQDPADSSEIDAGACVDPEADVEPAYLLWGINADHSRFPEQPSSAGTGLLQLAQSMLDTWAEPLRHLVAASDPDSLGYFQFNAADPAGDLTPWHIGPITALGDAVHAMPPTGGQGASTAIRDAGILTRCLSDARSGEPLADAVQAYERQMVTYARRAIRESTAPLRWQRRLTSPIAYQASRAILPVVEKARRHRRRWSAVG